MEFNGFFNSGGTGTTLITGGANENIPSYSELVCSNETMFFSGQFTNLSRELIHITIQGFGTASQFHKHDLRAYESFTILNVPIQSIAVHVAPNQVCGFHGMGTIWSSTDADEYAIMGAKSGMFEALPNSPQFNTDSYTRLTVAAITPATDLVASLLNEDYALYKLTISTDAAQQADFFWTDSVNGNVAFINRIDLAGAGTYSIDFDPSMLRNPNRQNGKIRFTLTTAASTTIDAIGHMVKAGQ